MRSNLGSLVLMIAIFVCSFSGETFGRGLNLRWPTHRCLDALSFISYKTQTYIELWRRHRAEALVKQVVAFHPMTFEDSSNRLIERIGQLTDPGVLLNVAYSLYENIFKKRAQLLASVDKSDEYYYSELIGRLQAAIFVQLNRAAKTLVLDAPAEGLRIVRARRVYFIHPYQDVADLLAIRNIQMEMEFPVRKSYGKWVHRSPTHENGDFIFVETQN